jgi:glycosyltransferase involved in cell wall biosynthesis
MEYLPISSHQNRPPEPTALSPARGAGKSILLLNYEFPPLGGGAGRGTYNLARELAKKGYDVDVLTSKAPGQQSKEELEGFTVHRVLSWRKGVHDCGFRGAITFVLFAIPVFLRLNRAKSYHILHYYFGLPTGVLQWLPGRHRRVPYIVSLRGSDVPGYDNFNTQLQYFHRLLLPVTRAIWNNAARIVALSEALKETALETAPAVEIEVIANGIESEQFHRAEMRRRSNKVQLICVARLVERKGIQHLLRAMQAMQHDVHLTIVGEGNYKQELINIADQYQVSDKVTFHGYCPREYLVELYSASDIFVLPTMAESFGLVFIEAMACGLPVIGTTVGGVPDIVTKENGILVEPDDYRGVRDAIDTLAGDKKRRLAMGAACRQRVLDYYSWLSVTEKYERCYAIAAGDIVDAPADNVATIDFKARAARKAGKSR